MKYTGDGLPVLHVSLQSFSLSPSVSSPRTCAIRRDNPSDFPRHLPGVPRTGPSHALHSKKNHQPYWCVVSLSSVISKISKGIFSRRATAVVALRVADPRDPADVPFFARPLARPIAHADHPRCSPAKKVWLMLPPWSGETTFARESTSWIRDARAVSRYRVRQACSTLPSLFRRDAIVASPPRMRTIKKPLALLCHPLHSLHFEPRRSSCHRVCRSTRARSPMAIRYVFEQQVQPVLGCTSWIREIVRFSVARTHRAPVPPL